MNKENVFAALDNIEAKFAQDHINEMISNKKDHPQELIWTGKDDNQKANYGYEIYQTIEGQWMLFDPTMNSNSQSGFFEMNSLSEALERAENSFQDSFEYFTNGYWGGK